MSGRIKQIFLIAMLCLMTEAAVTAAEPAAGKSPASGQAASSGTAGETEWRMAFAKLTEDTFERENYRDYAAGAEKLLLSLPPDVSNIETLEVFRRQLNIVRTSLLRLGEYSQLDTLYDALVKRFGGNFSAVWRIVDAGQRQEYGFMIGGKFVHDAKRYSNAEAASAFRRNRAEDLKLLLSFLPMADEHPEKVSYYLTLASVLAKGGSYGDMTELTGTLKLPEIELAGQRRKHPLPLSEDGKVIFFHEPESFAGAVNDLERFRYAAARAGAAGERVWYEFVRHNFGLDKLGVYWRFNASPGGRKFLKELAEDETLCIAGADRSLRKVKLPPDYNYIAYFRKNGDFTALYNIFMARHQYKKAADVLRERKDRNNNAFWQERLNMLTGKWGELSAVSQQRPGEIALPLCFRNAKEAELTVTEFDLAKALKTIEGEWKKSAARRYENIDTLLSRMTDAEHLPEFAGKEVVRKKYSLSPLPECEEKTEKLKFTLNKPGAYFVKVKMTGGNESSTLLLLSDVSLSYSSYDGQNMLFALDSGSGGGVAGVKLRLFSPQKEMFFAADGKTGRNGIYEITSREFAGKYVSAVAEKDGSYAFLSFYINQHNGQDKFRRKSFFIPAQPVFRPGDSVPFTVYTRNISYDPAVEAVPEIKTLKVVITSPRGGKVFEKELPFDRKTGCCTGEFSLPPDAPLGTYYCNTGGSFKVEKFRKPEYILTVTPQSERISPGEKAVFKLHSSYYFGAPLVNARINYTVKRRFRTFSPHLPGRFDWLYGENYRKCTSFCRYDSKALPETDWPYRLPEETVLQGEGRSGSDGSFAVEVPTGKIDRRNSGDGGFEYILDAEVRDESNYISRASGRISVPFQAFNVYLQSNGGWFRSGRKIKMHLSAGIPDGGMLSGSGEVKIFRRRLTADGTWQKEAGPVYEKNCDFTENGTEFDLTVNSSGNFIAEASVYNEKLKKRSFGRCPLDVVGEDEDDDEISGVVSSYPLSLSSDRISYRPGDTAKILLTTDRAWSVVWVYLPHRKEWRKIELKSATGAIWEVDLQKSDRPNTEVYAFMVRDNKFYQVSKTIYLPPERMELKVEVVPEKSICKPGEKTKFRLKISDQSGHAPSGSVTVAVYDKALDQIAPGRIPDIFRFFWNFREFFSGRVFSCLDNLFDVWTAPVMEHPGGGAVPLAANNMLRKGGNAPADTKTGETDAAVADAAGDEPETAVRRDFADRILYMASHPIPYWGKMEIPLILPDNLTTWRIRAWAVADDAKAGEGSGEITVNKPLLARLNLPRFLTVSDRLELGAVIHNNTGKTLKINKLELKSPGGVLSILPGSASSPTQIAPRSSAAVTWDVSAENSGTAKLSLFVSAASVDGEVFSDVLESVLPVQERGFERTVAFSGTLSGTNRTAVMNIAVPEARRENSARLKIGMSPGLVHLLPEILPHLAPGKNPATSYECVNSFVPVFCASGAMRQLKTPPDKNVQNLLLAGQRSLKKLFDSQLSDGGWGWILGGGEVSSLDTTLYVLDALGDAKICDEHVKRALSYIGKELASRQEKEITPALAADCCYVLAKHGIYRDDLAEYAFKQRRELGLFRLARLGCAIKDTEKRNIIGENLKQYLKTNPENGTAYFDDAACNNRWNYSSVDAVVQSAALEFLLLTGTDSELPGQLAKYLACNIYRAPHSNSPMSLSYGVRALSKYLAHKGIRPGADKVRHIEILVDGGSFRTYFFYPGQTSGAECIIDEKEFGGGSHIVELRQLGNNPGEIYFDVMLQYFSREEETAPAGNGLTLNRKFFLVENLPAEEKIFENGNWKSVTVWKERKKPLHTLQEIRPGDIVEVELSGTAEQDCSFVRFTDRRIAGLECERSSSGFISYFPQIYAEFHDRTAVFYWKNLPRGDFVMKYRLYAAGNGEFTALPASGGGIYAPALFADSAYFQLKIK